MYRVVWSLLRDVNSAPTWGSFAHLLLQGIEKHSVTRILNTDRHRVSSPEVRGKRPPLGKLRADTRRGALGAGEGALAGVARKVDLVR